MSTVKDDPFKEANKKLLRIWRKYRGDKTMLKRMSEDLKEDQKDLPLSLWPNQYPSMDPNSRKNYVLFIGINPSARAESMPIVRIKSGEKISMPNSERIIEYEESERGDESGNSSFFKPLENIANSIEATFKDIDVFAVRMTSSENLKKLLAQTNYRTFFEDQLGVFNELLEDIIRFIPPKAIVMNNVTTSLLLFGKCAEMAGVELQGIEIEPSNYEILNRNGCHEISIERGKKKIPLFLSGFIPQGRTDRFAIERLKWHLELVVTSQ